MGAVSMHMLITGGGTRVAIDPVRHIGNISTGQFAAALAMAALNAQAEVTYLVSREGCAPFSCVINQVDNINDLPVDQHNMQQLLALADLYHRLGQRYREYRYGYFHEYHSLLEQLVKETKPQVVILAAAVSDYLVTHYSADKLCSHAAQVVQLTPAPKLIQLIKQWSRQSFLVGFKLLVAANDAQLLAAARASMRQNHADLIVANNVGATRDGTREVLLVKSDGSYVKYQQHAAQQIIRVILAQVMDQHDDA